MLTNKYSSWYFSIVNRAKSQNRSKSKDNYFEKHHIIPKSLNGRNTKDNLVLLTAKEHYICHLLLVKMTEGKDKANMFFAFKSMNISNEYTKRHNAKSFEFFRIAFRNSICGENHPRYGTTVSDETKAKISSTRKALSIPSPQKGKVLSAEVREKMSISKKGRSQPKIKEALSCNWLITTPMGETMVVKNLRQFERDYGVYTSNLVRHGKSKGYTCVKL